jgi:hypothetical protein
MAIGIQLGLAVLAKPDNLVDTLSMTTLRPRR